MSRKSLICTKLFSDFHPMWFASTMGTGISSVVLYTYPYEGHWLKVCSYIMFGVCLFLFILYNVFLITGCLMYKDRYVRLFFNVGESAFLGCYSMGFSSIISYLHLITGEKWVTTLFVLWIINIAVSLFTAWVVLFFIHWKSDIEASKIHASFLLPVVTQNVVAAVGGALYTNIHPNLRLPNIIISYLCWSNGIALTIWVIAVYMWKLFVYKVPSGSNNGFPAFLPVGAFGQGAYGIMLICNNFKEYLWVHDPTFLKIGESNGQSLQIANIVIGDSVKYGGLFMGLFLVANGYYFTFNAILSVWSAGVNGFSKAWWSCTFPLGTMALANHELYILYGFKAFRIIGAIYSTVLVIMTVTCLFGSLVYEFPHEIYKKSETLPTKTE